MEKNVTFIIPVRIDSEDRLRNLKVCLRFLKRNFKGSNIILKESDTYSKIKNINLDDISYIFEYNNKSYFHRTKILNDMIKMSKTDITVNYDLDVLIDINSFYESCDLILNHNYDLIYPYGHGMWCRHIEYDNFKDILEKDNFNPSEIISNNGPSDKGHVKFHKTSSYIEAGMENEEFISWGYEDLEIYYRFEKLGYKIGRINKYVYHIEHARYENSSELNPYVNNNINIFNFVKNCTKEELIHYISNVKYLK